MDDVKRLLLSVKEAEQEVSQQSSESDEPNNTPENTASEDSQFENNLEEKHQENKIEKPEKNEAPEDVDKYIIEIPSGTKLEQIHALKDYLSSQLTGHIHIFILLGGREIDTKLTLSTLS